VLGYETRNYPTHLSDAAITYMALLSAVYRLALRATQGLLASVLKITQGETAGATLNYFMSAAPKACVNLPRHAKAEPVHMVVDATGIKVYGEAEWKVPSHGYSKRRIWRKLHFGVDEAIGEVVAAVATTNDSSDGQLLPELLN
jgi:hypothetical protein